MPTEITKLKRIPIIFPVLGNWCELGIPNLVWVFLMSSYLIGQSGKLRSYGFWVIYGHKSTHTNTPHKSAHTHKFELSYLKC